jgi:capsule polysaccharide export protein KpsE/RkpR
VKKLNNKIVTLKIKKAKENRQFLEKRVNDVKDSLQYAEDKLEQFQKKTGMYEAESQTKAILEQIAKFQAQIAEKQTEYSIYKQLYGDNSAQAENAKIVAKEFALKLKQIEAGKDSINTMLSLNKLPENAINYFRLYGNVQIYTKILEFELPLYEQAKFQEQKDVPILQVIDPAIPPAKRSFPKRTIMAFLITIVLMLILLVFILLKENKNLAGSNEYLYIKNNLFKWKPQDYKS